MTPLLLDIGPPCDAPKIALSDAKSIVSGNDCEECDGYGSNTCLACDGDGYCSVCEGEMSIECTACEGSGASDETLLALIEVAERIWARDIGRGVKGTVAEYLAFAEESIYQGES